MLRQKLSIVVICAICIIASCLWRFLSDGFSSIILSSAAPIRSRICAAAALVNVTTTSRSISTWLSGSVIMRIILSTRTAVLPEPAAAETRIFLLWSSIALFCCAVQFLAISHLLLFTIHIKAFPYFIILKMPYSSV